MRPHGSPLANSSPPQEANIAPVPGAGAERMARDSGLLGWSASILVANQPEKATTVSSERPLRGLGLWIRRNLRPSMSERPPA